MHLNAVKVITESSAVSLGFYENQVIWICRPRRLYQGPIRNMYCIKTKFGSHTHTGPTQQEALHNVKKYHELFSVVSHVIQIPLTCDLQESLSIQFHAISYMPLN